MSEQIPESVPTSADPRSKRPTKKRALTPASTAASQISSLMADPAREIQLPSSSSTKALAAPPEIVANVQGSSAGAGSGEFHVYKASRRREYERIGRMEAEVKEEQEKEEWERKVEEMKRKDEERTQKNSEKRAKAKARKGKGGKGGQDGKQDLGTAVQKKGPSSTNCGSAQNHSENKAHEDIVNGNGEGKPIKSPEEIGVIIHDDD